MRRPWTRWNHFLGLTNRSRPLTRRRAATRLQLEGLEDRIVPSTLFIDQFGTSIYSGGQSIEVRAVGGGYQFSASEAITVYGPGAGFAQGSGTNTVVTSFSSYLQVDSVQSIQLDSNNTQVGITDNSHVGEFIALGDSTTQTLQGILAPVSIDTPAGDAELDIFDSGDNGTHQSATLSSGSLTNLAPAPITWSPAGLSQLYIDASGNVEDIFTVQSTGPFPTYLLPGNSSEVDAQSTSGSLTVYGDSTAIYVGSNAPFGGGTLAGIQGQVNAYQLPGRGPVYLSIDDSGDVTGQVATISRDGFGLDDLTGLAPATITWDPAALDPTASSALSIYGGSGGNAFNIDNLDGSYHTTLDTGSGVNTVTVRANTSPLQLAGSGTTSLYVDDFFDTTSRNATLASNSLTGLTGGPISWNPAQLAYLSIVGSSGASNTYTVTGTGPFNTDLYSEGIDTMNVQATTGSLTLHAGAGGDSINVGDAANPLDGIQGALAVIGQGNTTLTLNDTGGNPGAAPNHAYNYSLTQNSFSRTGTATVTFSGVASVNLDTSNAGSTGYDIIGVASTAAGTSYQVNAGTGYNQFVVADNNYTLNGIHGSLYLHGAGSGVSNDDLLEMEDADKTTRHTFLFTAGATSQSGLVQRFNSATHASDMAPISYDGLNAYSVLSTNGDLGDTINVQSEAAQAYTIIGAGTGDTVNVGNTSHTMAGILGDVQVQAIQGQRPTVTLDDSQDANAKTITMSTLSPYGYQITGLLPPSSVGYGNIWLQDTAMQVTLKTGAGSNDVFQVNDLTAAPVLKIDAGNGSNTLVGPNQATTWNITGANSGKLGSISFSNVQNLVGGTGVDVFKFSGTSAKVSSINGGGAPAGQGDWLNYASLPSSSTVTVNLATGSATNVNGGAAGAVTNIQNVIGSATGTNNLTGDSQGNILIGGSGLNTLVGGSGNSLLIGGSGHGSITGGSGTDILIAGTTTYNATTAAGETSLMAILAELQSADTFAQKVSDLIHGNNSGGGSDLNGRNKLTWGVSGTTVKASTGAFTLKGDTSSSSNPDWFFSNASSTVSDFNDDGVQDEHNNNALGVF